MRAFFFNFFGACIISFCSLIFFFLLYGAVSIYTDLNRLFTYHLQQNRSDHLCMYSFHRPVQENLHCLQALISCTCETALHHVHRTCTCYHYSVHLWKSEWKIYTDDGVSFSERNQCVQGRERHVQTEYLSFQLSLADSIGTGFFGSEPAILTQHMICLLHSLNLFPEQDFLTCCM